MLRVNRRGAARDGWRVRDGLAALALFAATAAAVLWQNRHVAVLWDISYVQDTAWRIACGQVPYRDFPLVHAPLTFLIQAAVIRLTGRVFLHAVLYAAGAAGLATVVAWRIVLRELRGAWLAALLLAMPLTVLGIYGIFPTPFYDCDCILFVLLAVWLLQRAERGRGWAFAAGAAAVVPVFCKQNIGVPFLLVVVLGAAAMALRRELRGRLGMVLAGTTAAMAGAVLLLQATVGVKTYLYWTVTFAGQRRLPGLGAMVDVYREPSLVWTLPCVAAGAWLVRSRRSGAVWARCLGTALLAAPLAPVLLSLALTQDADDRASALLALWPLLLVLAAAHTLWQLRGLAPGAKARTYPAWAGVIALALLAAVHGSMLSQQLWGSTYAIWPLFVVLLAQMLAQMLDPMLDPMLGSLAVPPRGAATRFVLPGLSAAAGVTLLVCGGLYMVSDDRLTYAHIEDGPVVASRHAALRGMSVRGVYMPEFDQLLDFAAREIPPGDGLILIPGEDPFYYATGRVPRFPVLLFDPTTQPYTPDELVELAKARDIRWLIVKTHLQSKIDVTPDRDATLAALGREFGMYRQLDGYAVYRRR